ncbi:MAG TPA: N,N-dimethylformamidase beta subunit family domain-containing protein, partial [Gemmata sp.]|nr:N,N-dimethylformamidase beta subunit family domain-containing protein [Gemmata sp.]
MMTPTKITRRDAIKTGAALTAAAALPIETIAYADDPPKPAPKPPLFIHAYTDRMSYAPGEEVKVHLSTNAEKCMIITDFESLEDDKRGETPIVPGKDFPIPEDASSHGCRWPVAIKYTIPHNTKSGYYRIKVIAPNAPSLLQRANCDIVLAETFFVVRPKEPGKNSKILLQLSTNTYNAYTNWGGYSLYAYNGKHKVQGRRVSFDRPITSQFDRWEKHFVEWAEKAGYKLDYCVNSDLEFRPELLNYYKLVLSVGHDEYWSAPMRDNLEKYIGDGGNVAFFSGNTCCWQVRSEDNGRALACWKQSFGDDPSYKSGNHKLLTSLWSHYLVGRPENSLTGVGFPWGGYHRSHGQFMDGSGAYSAHRPDHWLLSGTNLKRGDTFGAKLPGYKVVGYECDGC